MAELLEAFEERFSEIEAYISFLQGIEALAQSGIPRLGSDGPPVTVQQTRILYSSVYLQLYNLVEATVTRCVDGVTKIAIGSGLWLPGDLADELRREWVRAMAKSHVELNSENRLKSALELCDHLVSALPVSSFKLEKGGGGNWDDTTIEAVAKRMGCRLRVGRSARSGVKRKFRGDEGALGLIVSQRNKLAHGSISFAECGENDTASELLDLTRRTAAYMRDVVRTFEAFIDGHEYLRPDRRPNQAAAN